MNPKRTPYSARLIATAATAGTTATLGTAVGALALLSSCAATPQLQPAGTAAHSFRVSGVSGRRPVLAIKVWSLSRDVRLWELTPRDPHKRSLHQEGIHYGTVPAHMQQGFPSRGTPPAVRPGEQLLVHVLYGDDSFMAPGSGTTRAVFSVQAGGHWKMDVTARQLHRLTPALWTSLRERQTMERRIRRELTPAALSRFFRQPDLNRALGITMGKRRGRLGYLHLRRSRELSLTHQGLTDIAPLRQLTNLQRLFAGHNRIGNVAALGRLHRLETLDLSHNLIEDARSLGNLQGLTVLGLAHNRISNLAFAARLKRLSDLDASRNRITSVQPLGGLQQLRAVRLNHNRIANADALAGLAAVHIIEVRCNAIRDPRPLFGHARRRMRDLNPQLGYVLDMRGNPLLPSARPPTIPPALKQRFQILLGPHPCSLPQTHHTPN